MAILIAVDHARYSAGSERLVKGKFSHKILSMADHLVDVESLPAMRWCPGVVIEVTANGAFLHHLTLPMESAEGLRRRFGEGRFFLKMFDEAGRVALIREYPDPAASVPAGKRLPEPGDASS